MTSPPPSPPGAKVQAPIPLGGGLDFCTWGGGGRGGIKNPQKACSRDKIEKTQNSIFGHSVPLILMEKKHIFIRQWGGEGDPPINGGWGGVGGSPPINGG